MSLSNYPVFEKWMHILDWIFDTSEKYPKSVRFTLANRTINHALEIEELLIEAIYTKKRLPMLYKINIYVEKIRVLMRIAHKRSYISTKQYGYISEAINNFGSMIGGWIKSEQTKTTKPVND